MLESVQCDFCGWEGFIGELIPDKYEIDDYINEEKHRCPRCFNCL